MPPPVSDEEQRGNQQLTVPTRPPHSKAALSSRIAGRAGPIPLRVPPAPRSRRRRVVFFGGAAPGAVSPPSEIDPIDRDPPMSLRERVEGALRGDPALAPPRRWARRWEEDSPLPSPPALDMSCDPYPYQRQAAHLLDSTLHERSLGNLLVASPTGSGKTFAIKWAAKRALEMGWRLVVAVPLVALAEQIFAQLRALLRGVEPAQACPSDAFLDSFDDEEGYFDSCCDWSSGSVSDPESPVGIRTGPSEMFPDAPVLVCTYEVVLIQLNRSVSFFDRMPLLIIDEVHTIADPERGHVTENLINHPAIPPGVRFVGMSGTLPNALDLAEFMGRANRQPTWVVGARRRPIDITFYVHTLTHADQEGSDEAEGDRRTRSGALRKIYDTQSKAYTAPPEPAARSIRISAGSRASTGTGCCG